MKIFHITLVSCLLLSALLAGCRNRPADTSVPSTAPSTAATTAPRQTMPPATMPPVRPSTGPTVTMPSGTDAVNEQKFLAENIRGARYHEITSKFGHDGFLLENDQLTEIIKPLLQ